MKKDKDNLMVTWMICMFVILTIIALIQYEQSQAAAPEIYMDTYSVNDLVSPSELYQGSLWEQSSVVDMVRWSANSPATSGMPVIYSSSRGPTAPPGDIAPIMGGVFVRHHYRYETAERETNTIVVTQRIDSCEPQPFKIELFTNGVDQPEEMETPFLWEPESLLGLKLPMNRWEQFISEAIVVKWLPWAGATVHDGDIKLRGSLMPDPFEHLSETYCRLRQLYFEELWCPGLTVSPTSRFDTLTEAREVPAPDEDFPRILGWPVNNKDARRSLPSTPDEKVNLDPIEYEGIMVGRPDFISSVPGLALVPVQVDGHPEIQKAFFDCSIADVMGAPCASIQNMMRKNPTKVRIRQVQVEFLANQPVSIWVIEF